MIFGKRKQFFIDMQNVYRLEAKGAVSSCLAAYRSAHYFVKVHGPKIIHCRIQEHVSMRCESILDHADIDCK